MSIVAARCSGNFSLFYMQSNRHSTYGLHWAWALISLWTRSLNRNIERQKIWCTNFLITLKPFHSYQLIALLFWTAIGINWECTKSLLQSSLLVRSISKENLYIFILFNSRLVKVNYSLVIGRRCCQFCGYFVLVVGTEHWRNWLSHIGGTGQAAGCGRCGEYTSDWS